MSDSAGNPHRQQELYWSQMVELKVAASYVRRYRDYCGAWTRRLGTVRAIASSGSIAAWALWREYAFLWAAIIATSQVADALKDVFPFAKIQKSAGEHTTSLTGIFIDAQLEWEKIYSGCYTDEEIMERRHRLMKLQHESESQSFPDGLQFRDGLFALAQQEAQDYFTTTYGV